MNLAYLLVALLGYVVGGIPSAYLAGRVRGIDIRRHGSGNVGATNAFRLLGMWWGGVVLAVDIGKGVFAAGVVPQWIGGGEPVFLGIAGAVGAILGHVFTPFLRFRGGKGVATSAGALLALLPLPSAVALVVFAGAVGVTRIVSVGSLAAAAALPTAAALWVRDDPSQTPLVYLAAGLACLVLITHRGNIRRLVQGTEPRVARRGRREP